MINDKPSLDTLAHYGIKGMKWGVIRKQKKLNRMATKAERYQYVSDKKKAAAKTIDRSARKEGPIAYGKEFNRINKMEIDSEQLARYAEYGRKRVSKYMHKLSKDYTIVYDVTTGSYTLRDKH